MDGLERINMIVLFALVICYINAQTLPAKTDGM